VAASTGHRHMANRHHKKRYQTIQNTDLMLVSWLVSLISHSLLLSLSLYISLSRSTEDRRPTTRCITASQSEPPRHEEVDDNDVGQDSSEYIQLDQLSEVEREGTEADLAQLARLAGFEE